MAQVRPRHLQDATYNLDDVLNTQQNTRTIVKQVLFAMMFTTNYFAIQSWQLICVRENIHLNLSVAGHLDEDFRQPMYLCPVDLRKLQTLCGFNVIDRYQGLCRFFRKHGMDEEADWMRRRVEFIKE